VLLRARAHTCARVCAVAYGLLRDRCFLLHPRVSGCSSCVKTNPQDPVPSLPSFRIAFSFASLFLFILFSFSLSLSLSPVEFRRARIREIRIPEYSFFC